MDDKDVQTQAQELTKDITGATPATKIQSPKIGGEEVNKVEPSDNSQENVSPEQPQMYSGYGTPGTEDVFQREGSTEYNTPDGIGYIGGAVSPNTKLSSAQVAENAVNMAAKLSLVKTHPVEFLGMRGDVDTLNKKKAIYELATLYSRADMPWWVGYENIPLYEEDEALVHAIGRGVVNFLTNTAVTAVHVLPEIAALAEYGVGSIVGSDDMVTVGKQLSKDILDSWATATEATSWTYTPYGDDDSANLTGNIIGQLVMSMGVSMLAGVGNAAVLAGLEGTANAFQAQKDAMDRGISFSGSLGRGLLAGGLTAGLGISTKGVERLLKSTINPLNTSMAMALKDPSLFKRWATGEKILVGVYDAFGEAAQDFGSSWIGKGEVDAQDWEVAAVTFMVGGVVGTSLGVIGAKNDFKAKQELAKRINDFRGSTKELREKIIKESHGAITEKTFEEYFNMLMSGAPQKDVHEFILQRGFENLDKLKGLSPEQKTLLTTNLQNIMKNSGKGIAREFDALDNAIEAKYGDIPSDVKEHVRDVIHIVAMQNLLYTGQLPSKITLPELGLEYGNASSYEKSTNKVTVGVNSSKMSDLGRANDKTKNVAYNRSAKVYNAAKSAYKDSSSTERSKTIADIQHELTHWAESVLGLKEIPQYIQFMNTLAEKILAVRGGLDPEETRAYAMSYIENFAESVGMGKDSAKDYLLLFDQFAAINDTSKALKAYNDAMKTLIKKNRADLDSIVELYGKQGDQYLRKAMKKFVDGGKVDAVSEKDINRLMEIIASINDFSTTAKIDEVLGHEVAKGLLDRYETIHQNFAKKSEAEKVLKQEKERAKQEQKKYKQSQKTGLDTSGNSVATTDVIIETLKDDIKKEEAKVEETKAKEPNVEDVKTEEVATEEPKVEEAKAEEVVTEEAVTEEPKAEAKEKKNAIRVTDKDDVNEVVTKSLHWIRDILTYGNQRGEYKDGKGGKFKTHYTAKELVPNSLTSIKNEKDSSGQIVIPEEIQKRIEKRAQLIRSQNACSKVTAEKMAKNISRHLSNIFEATGFSSMQELANVINSIKGLDEDNTQYSVSGEITWDEASEMMRNKLLDGNKRVWDLFDFYSKLRDSKANRAAASEKKMAKSIDEDLGEGTSKNLDQKISTLKKNIEYDQERMNNSRGFEKDFIEDSIHKKEYVLERLMKLSEQRQTVAALRADADSEYTVERFLSEYIETQKDWGKTPQEAKLNKLYSKYLSDLEDRISNAKNDNAKAALEKKKSREYFMHLLLQDYKKGEGIFANVAKDFFEETNDDGFGYKAYQQEYKKYAADYAKEHSDDLTFEQYLKEKQRQALYSTEKAKAATSALDSFVDIGQRIEDVYNSIGRLYGDKNAFYNVLNYQKDVYELRGYALVFKGAKQAPKFIDSSAVASDLSTSIFSEENEDLKIINLVNAANNDLFGIEDAIDYLSQTTKNDEEWDLIRSKVEGLREDISRVEEKFINDLKTRDLIEEEGFAPDVSAWTKTGNARDVLDPSRNVIKTAMRALATGDVKYFMKDFWDGVVGGFSKKARHSVKEESLAPRYNPNGPNYYTGIGARSADAQAQKAIEDVATWLADKGFTLRSGGASGADTFFERVHNAKGAPKEIYMPSNTKRKDVIVPEFYYDEVRTMNPYFDSLDQDAKELIARDMNQIYGADRNNPAYSLFVVYWAPDGDLQGRTSYAVKAAMSRDIPVFNLATMSTAEVKQKISQIMSGKTEAETAKNRFGMTEAQVAKSDAEIEKRVDAFIDELTDGGDPEITQGLFRNKYKGVITDGHSFFSGIVSALTSDAGQVLLGSEEKISLENAGSSAHGYLIARSLPMIYDRLSNIFTQNVRDKVTFTKTQDTTIPQVVNGSAIDFPKTPGGGKQVDLLADEGFFPSASEEHDFVVGRKIAFPMNREFRTSKDEKKGIAGNRFVKGFIAAKINNDLGRGYIIRVTDIMAPNGKDSDGVSNFVSKNVVAKDIIISAEEMVTLGLRGSIYIKADRMSSDDLLESVGLGISKEYNVDGEDIAGVAVESMLAKTQAIGAIKNFVDIALDGQAEENMGPGLGNGSEDFKSDDDVNYSVSGTDLRDVEVDSHPFFTPEEIKFLDEIEGGEYHKFVVEELARREGEVVKKSQQKYALDRVTNAEVIRELCDANIPNFVNKVSNPVGDTGLTYFELAKDAIKTLKNRILNKTMLGITSMTGGTYQAIASIFGTDFANKLGIISQATIAQKNSEDVRQIVVSQVINEAFGDGEKITSKNREEYELWYQEINIDSIDAELTSGQKVKINKDELMTGYIAKLAAEGNEELDYKIGLKHGLKGFAWERFKEKYKNLDQLIENNLAEKDKKAAIAIAKIHAKQRGEPVVMGEDFLSKDFVPMVSFESYKRDGWVLRKKHSGSEFADSYLTAPSYAMPGLLESVIVVAGQEATSSAGLRSVLGALDFLLNFSEKVDNKNIYMGAKENFLSHFRPDRRNQEGFSSSEAYDKIQELSEELVGLIEEKAGAGALNKLRSELRAGLKNHTEIEAPKGVVAKVVAHITRAAMASKLMFKPIQAVQNYTQNFMMMGSLSNSSLGKWYTKDFVSELTASSVLEDIKFFKEAAKADNGYPVWLTARWLTAGLSGEYQRSVDLRADSVLQMLERETLKNQHLSGAKLLAKLDVAFKKATKVGVGYTNAAPDVLGLLAGYRRVFPVICQQIAKKTGYADTTPFVQREANDYIETFVATHVSSTNVMVRSNTNRWLAEHGLEGMIAFKNDMFMKASAFATDYQEWINAKKNGDKEAQARAMKDMINIISTSAAYVIVRCGVIFTAAAALAGVDIPEEEREEMINTALQESLGQLTSSVPIGGYMLQGIIDNAIFGSSTGAFMPVSDLSQLVNHAVQGNVGALLGKSASLFGFGPGDRAYDVLRATTAWINSPSYSSRAYGSVLYGRSYKNSIKSFGLTEDKKTGNVKKKKAKKKSSED